MNKSESSKKIKKTLVTIFKIGVSVLLLYFVSTKISFAEVFQSIQQSNVFYLVLSGLFLLISQWVSAIRLNTFFHTIDYKLSHKSNTILYFIGMFYNFFIPGGIGGDAYKVYALNKAYGWKVKKLSAALFIDRFSGLTAIGVLLLGIGFKLLINFSLQIPLAALWVFFLLLIFVVIAISYFFTKKLFKSFLAVFKKTFVLSLIVQLLQLMSICLVVYGYGAEENLFEYLFVFLISVVLSIVSFAGIGVREYVFYQAAKWLHYSESTSVAVGLLFTFLTAIISLVGVFYIFKKVPLQKEVS